MSNIKQMRGSILPKVPAHMLRYKNKYLFQYVATDISHSDTIQAAQVY
jgi:hypothetical protein